MEDIVEALLVSMERKLNIHGIELDVNETDEVRELLDQILENKQLEEEV